MSGVEQPAASVTPICAPTRLQIALSVGQVGRLFQQIESNNAMFTLVSHGRDGNCDIIVDIVSHI